MRCHSVGCGTARKASEKIIDAQGGILLHRNRGQKPQMKTNPFVCRAGFLSPSGDGFCPQQSQNSARHSGEMEEKNGIGGSK
jgi:hypothetical protein